MKLPLSTDFKRPINPALVPVVFFDGNTHYVGWQTNGMLISTLDCEYISKPFVAGSVDGLSSGKLYSTRIPKKKKSGVCYRVHLQGKGWMPPGRDDEMDLTTG